MASEEYPSKTWKVARTRVAHAIAKIREEYAKATPRPTEHEPVDPPVPADLLNLLCRIGVALVGAGETSARVQVILDKLSRRYGTDNIHFMVLPTAVFVRVRTDESSAIDMLDACVGTLPLDQIDGLYRLIDQIEQDAPPPSQATMDLDKILTQKPGSPPWLILLGQVVLTVGIGMMLNPGARALVGYVVLGLVVGALTQLADKVRLLSMALPVVASAVVAALAYGFPGALAGGQPQQLLIPAVATLLPGAMLTNGTIELATGSMVAGASRVVYGINMLFLLALGSYVGISLLGPLSDPPVSTAQLGWWAPLLGVLLIGYGHSWRSSAPQNTVGWLLLVLYVTYAAQVLGKHVSGPLTGTFLGGLVAVNAAYLIQSRKHAPPTQVAFLPAFWMLVPGGISYTGISDLVTHSLSGVSSGGLEVLVSALLSVMSIALGVMVGSGLATAHTPRVSTLIDTVVPHHLPWIHTAGTSKKPDSDS
ncbi:threonine/serine ThrE exporter family protein [Nocardia salmonicida]|uniref:threonine/serine ThrE exporter family protein n=1 Tax=Nocardia salmonicida TaxID=53431 RepID=UPI002E28B273|nr:threonine/serine exporter family protein [Nocardia salmonicida]